jgi:hypothetical protein
MKREGNVLRQERCPHGSPLPLRAAKSTSVASFIGPLRVSLPDYAPASSFTRRD